MIQITLDPIMLTPKPDNTACEVAVNLAGCSLVDNSAGVGTWNKTQVKNNLYPWNWKDRPTHFRIHWVKSGADPVAGDLIPIPDLSTTLARYITPSATATTSGTDDSDKQQLISYYESFLDDRLFDKDNNVSRNDIVISAAQSTKISIIDGDDAPLPGIITGYLNNTIIALAHKLPPLNAALNLAFFANSNSVAGAPGAEYDHFLLFPVKADAAGAIDSTSIWYYDKTQLLTYISGNTTMYQAAYLNPLDGEKINVCCPVRLVPQPATNTLTPIELFDNTGKFSGNVTVEATDVPGWPNNMIDTLESYFDLPGYMLKFITTSDGQGNLTLNRNLFADLNDLTKIDQFLWATLRDSLGLGSTEAFNKDRNIVNIVVDALATGHCDNKFGKLIDIAKSNVSRQIIKETQIAYYKEYDLVYTTLTFKKYNDGTQTNGRLWVYDKQQSFGIWQQKLINYFNGLINPDPDSAKRVKLLIDSQETRAMIPQLKQIINDWQNAAQQPDKWVNAWYNFLLLTQHNAFQCILIALQWQNAVIALNDEEIKVLAALGNIRASQQNSLAVHYKALLLDNTNNQDPAQITSNLGQAVVKYAISRIKPTDFGNFYPLIPADPLFAINIPTTAPVESTPAATPGFYDQFIQFLNNRFGKDVDGIQPLIKAKIQSVAGSMPDVLIKVDSYAAAPVNIGGQGDVNDEISGHILFSRRSDASGATDKSTWNVLNQAYVVLTPKGINPTDTVLSNTYLIPASIAENNGAKPAQLFLSSQKISVVRGHDINNDFHQDTGLSNEKLKDDISWGMSYSLGYDITSIAEKQLPVLQGPAFWYGFVYEFADFAPLNSGALPYALRAAILDAAQKPLYNPNVPALTLNPAITLPANNKKHTCLRKVAVSTIRLSAKSSDGQNPPLAIPNGLSPLAMELPEWKTYSEPILSAGEQNKPHLYLLADTTTNYKQNNLTLALRKPSTYFWNWHAWMNTAGKNQGTAVIEVGGPAINDKLEQLAYARELNYIRDKVDPSKQFVPQICDPAAANAIILVIEQMFPLAGNFEVYYVPFAVPQDNTDANLEDFTINLKVQFGNTSGNTSYSVKDNTLYVSAGSVLRMHTFSYVTQGDMAQKFHPWMDSTFYQWNTDNFIDKTGFLSALGDSIDQFYKPDPKDDAATQAQKKLLASLKKTECNNAYYTQPVETWFEGAVTTITTLLNLQASDINTALWNSMNIIQDDAETVSAHLQNNNKNYQLLAYLSLVEVKHQVWNWNGRLFDQKTFNDMISGWSSDAKSLDPAPDPTTGKIKTTAAMLWEAWAFSDRPDSSSYVYVSTLLADGTGKKNAKLFSDSRPGDTRALYYRFTLTAHSRYEKILKPGTNTVFDAVLTIPDPDLATPPTSPWKRYIRSSNISKPLPKPAIRFIIPLTSYIPEDWNTVPAGYNVAMQTGSLLVVLDGPWFNETGLAENIQIGIPVVSPPGDGTSLYLQAGGDPIITTDVLDKITLPATSVQQTGLDVANLDPSQTIATFMPAGPVGLTFEPTVQTPKINCTSFILNIPDLSKLIVTPVATATNKLNSWAIMQISLRRTLNKDLFNNPVIPDAASLNSEWTAKEWVQFVPSVDSFIPPSWRQEVKINGTVPININADGKGISFPNDATGKAYLNLPEFGTYFERFIIITDVANDIGGQPCERYVCTCSYIMNGTTHQISINHPQNATLPATLKNGYLRVMTLRGQSDGAKNAAQVAQAAQPAGSPIPSTMVWDRLFGDFAQGGKDITAIMNDPTAALPLVSEAVPFKVVTMSP